MYKIIGADSRGYGPVNLVQLRQWLTEGRISAQTRIQAEGAAGWKMLGDLPEFAGTVAGASIPQRIGPMVGPSGPTRYPQVNGCAATGLILGVVSLVLSFCCCGGLPLNLLGLILSAIGLAQIYRQPDVYTGQGVAVAGLIISGLSVLLGFGIIAVSVALNWNDILREMHKF
jgi:GYF domain 2